MNSLGTALKKFRERSGKSQRQAAEELGITHELLCFWETGKKKVAVKWFKSIVTLYALADEEKNKLFDLFCEMEMNILLHRFKKFVSELHQFSK